MRTTALLLTALGIAACTSVYGSKFSGPTELTPEDAFDCIVERVNELGYSVTTADRANGFVAAKTPQPVGMKLNGEPFFDEISVSVSRSSDPISLEVTATDKQHARELLSRCG